MKRTLIFACLLLPLACTQSQKKDASAQPAFRALGTKVTVDETHSDESIGFEVRKRINLAGPTDLAAVIIEVENGVVTLRGSTPNQQAAWRAVGAARAVPGVKNVINEIQLTYPGPNL